MDVHWIGVAFGAFIVVQSVRELARRLRLHFRGARAPGTIVGRVEVPGTGRSTGRSGIFRFTTERNETIEARSSAYTPRGPRPGKPVTVVYDPDRPDRGAERLGVHLVLMAAVLPLLIVVGIAVIALNLADM
ncbi:DUF3592 domain-containing protein [Spirillospora sp. NPDC127200]